MSFPLMQSSSAYVWSRESAELRVESRSGSNAGQSSKARSNKIFFLQLYFSEAKSKFSTHLNYLLILDDFQKNVQFQILLSEMAGIFEKEMYDLIYIRWDKLQKQISDLHSASLLGSLD